MHRTRLLLTTVVLLLQFTMACSTARHQFARAEHLEQAGKDADAVVAYQKLLDQVPTQNSRTRSQIYYRMGECFYRLNRIAEAFTSYQKASEIEPTNFAARLRLGEFFLAAGAPERAREQAEAIMRSSPASNDGLGLWAGALAAAGKNDLAKDAYQRLLSADPKRVSAAVALADIYNTENDVEAARRVLHEAAAANPQSALPWLALGRLSEQQGEVAAAEEAYRKAVAAEDTPESNLRLAQFLQRTSRVNEAEQVLRRVDAQRPTQPTAFPDFELISGKPDTALQNYQTALKSASTERPDRKAAASSQQIRNRALLATRLVEADIDVANVKSGKERNDAIQHARAHLAEYRLDLDAATLAIVQAELALTDSDLPTAALQANKAVVLAPQSAPAHYVLGLTKHQTNDDAGARMEWLTSLQADSQFVPARVALAELALNSDDSKGAEQYIVSVIRNEPGNVRALNLFARVLLREKRYPAAAVLAHRAMAIDSSTPEPHVVLGRSALEQQRVGDALIQFEQAILLDPHSQDAIDGLTRVYRTGRITRPMLAKMETVANANPPSATLLEIAGRLYAEHGWYRDAERCLQAALRIDPQRGTAATALAKTYVATGQLSAAADSAARTGGNSAALIAGVRAEEQNNVSAAISHYERAIQQGEHSGVAANNLAWLYAKQGTNLDRALQLAESARTQAPENPAVLDTVGVVRLRLRKYSEAISALESARRLAGDHPDDPELLAQIRRHLAEAYLRAGKTDAAASVERQ